MKSPRDRYWEKRLETLKETLEGNNFEVHLAADTEAARKIVLDTIFPATKARSVSWGGSMTLETTGLMEAFKAMEGVEVMDTVARNQSPEQFIERRRQALLVDLFITGTNAVTETGQLVNLDCIGNRVGGLTFGPRHVVILVGRNKVVPDLESAMDRIKDFAAPANAIRLERKTPCTKTSFCEECKSPDRICNTWTITEKSFPKGRVRVILINQDLGL